MERRLVTFTQVVDAGSFTKAATLLRVSQPALTNAVKKLERELHAELLIRTTHKLQLTAAGRLAYDAGKALTTTTDNLQTRLGESTHSTVVCRLGMIDSLATLLFVRGPYLTETERRMQLSLTVDNSSRLITLTQQGGLDAALIALPPKLSPSLVTSFIGDEALVLVTHRDQKKQTQKELGTGQLRHFLSYNQGSHTARLIEEHFAGRQIELEPVFHSTSPEIMLQLALTGRGAAVLPYLLVRSFLHDGTLAPLFVGTTCIIRRKVVSIRRPGRVLPEAALDVWHAASNELQRLSAEAERL